MVVTKGKRRVTLEGEVGVGRRDVTHPECGNLAPSARKECEFELLLYSGCRNQ